jgi:D-glycero-D-manno-heptose 1,7-bisphosphate phosphatase
VNREKPVNPPNLENPENLKPAVFLDRDGTIIEDVGYLRRLEDIEVFPWTVDAIRALNDAGFLVIVVTNQSGIARGYLTEPQLETVHAEIDRTLTAGGARIAAYYYCPHHPDGTVPPYATACDCRKPASGLVERATRDLGVDLSRSFVVGDTWLDVGLARATGARAVLVRTGDGRNQEARPRAGVSADAIVDNLAAAASWILINR